MNKKIYIPLKPEVEDRKVRFEVLNQFILKHNGWMISIPGDPEMRFQALPGSLLPDHLRKLGYIVTATGETQRILPHAIVEELVTLADGTAAPLIENSTRPVARRVTHTGIVTVTEFDLRVP